MKKENVKYKFIVNSWITGIFKNERVYGITSIIDGIESISIVTESAQLLILDWTKLEVPNILKITNETNVVINQETFDNSLTKLLASQNININ